MDICWSEYDPLKGIPLKEMGWGYVAERGDIMLLYVVQSIMEYSITVAVVGWVYVRGDSMLLGVGHTI